MPENKNQHYVPRAHLRPFTKDGAGSAINLLNIDSDLFVEDAPVKGQCSRDYFYGRDGRIEKALQVPEGGYATLVNQAENDPHSLSEKDLSNLRDFALLQSMRSFGQVERMLQQFRDFDKSIERDGMMPEGWFELGHQDAVHMALDMALGIRDQVDDLSSALVVNKTRVDFVTSDDPAVFTNRFSIQRLGKSGGGLANSGTMVFLPLTPKLLFLGYDPFVYSPKKRTRNVVTIDRDSEARELNKIQLLHCRKNVYFREWDTRQSVLNEFDKVRDLRPENWHTFSFFVEEPPGSDRYRQATEEESKRPGASLIVQTFTQVCPDVWPSILPFKISPKFVQTGTGAGVVRPGHKSLADSFEKFVRRHRPHRAPRVSGPSRPNGTPTVD